MNDYITIPLSKMGKNKGKYETLVSIVDAEYVMQFNWSIYKNRKQYYVQHRIKQKRVHLHRVVLERKIERALLPHEYPDHINGNGLDNRRENLRVATKSENLSNRGKPKNNTSGYKGVSKSDNKWAASIQFKGKRTHLGLFDTPELAHKAYCEKAKELHGEFANYGV